MENFSEKFGNLVKEMPISNRWRSACRIVAKKVGRRATESCQKH